MSKKLAVLLTVLAMIGVYLFLFIGVPMLATMASDYVGANETSMLDDEGRALFPTANETRGTPLRPKSQWEMSETPWPMYSIPGLVFIGIIVAILRQKKEAK